MSGTLKAEAKDDEAAKNLRDMLRGVVAMVKLQTSEKPALKTLADSLQLGGEGRTVAVAFAVPAEVFDALEALRQKNGTRRRRRRPALSDGARRQARQRPAHGPAVVVVQRPR